MSRFNLDIFDTITLFFSWYLRPSLCIESNMLNTQLVLTSVLLSLCIGFSLLVYTIIKPALNILLTLKTTSFLSIFMGIKFVILIGLLIVVRGGIPRYRYDFLTKLGWIKTLSLVLIIFIINLLLSYL